MSNWTGRMGKGAGHALRIMRDQNVSEKTARWVAAAERRVTRRAMATRRAS
jgi:uncharacterized protein (DUF2235 family)